jgi:MFS family permease
MYLIGALPALLTLWIRRDIPESELWERANDRRRAAAERQRSGAASAEDRALARFTLADLFVEPEIRRCTIVALLMATASATGFWAISTWVPPYVGSMAAKAGLTAPQWASYAGMTYTAGTIGGYICFGALADAYGRKPITLVFFALSLLLTPVLFQWTSNLQLLLAAAALLGFFASGQFTWMSSWLPELFPTRMRATGAGFIFNASRVPAACGVLISGAVIVYFGGYGNAATTIAMIYSSAWWPTRSCQRPPARRYRRERRTGWPTRAKIFLRRAESCLRSEPTMEAWKLRLSTFTRQINPAGVAAPSLR